MILEYHRPKTIEEALALLSRQSPETYPLGGGTALSRPGTRSYAVVDLQSLQLNEIKRQGNMLEVGAAVSLQRLSEDKDIQPELKEAARRTLNRNLRETATVAGALVTAKGNSPLATVLLALDARLVWAPGEIETSLGDYLPLRGQWTGGKLILRVVVPLQAGLQYEDTARTPADTPILCVAMAKWSSGRTRIIMGIEGNTPVLVLDGQDASGANEAIKNACSHSINHNKYSEQYLKQTANALVERILSQGIAL